MSAYLVNPYHIGRMAAYIAGDRNEAQYIKYHANIDESREIVGQVAVTLAMGNVYSIESRYGVGEADSFAGKPVAEWALECVAESRRVFLLGEVSHADMFNAAKCYEYQSCEFADWKDSDAKALCDLIKNKAATALASGSNVRELRKPERKSELIGL